MEKTTEYGTIKISDNVFERLVKESLALTDGRDYQAPERRPVIVTETDSEIVIEFHTIHKFGTSLRYSSKLALDHMEKSLKPLKLGKAILIRMKIVGIKARRTVKSELEYTRIIK